MHNNGKITKPINVRADIAYVLRESSGDVGTLCKSNQINKSSVKKPYRSSLVTTTEAARQAANYGWDILSKAAGANTLNFFLDIRNNKGADYSFWNYLKPRGLQNNEWFRVLDFDGYNHNEQPYRSPVTFNRLEASELSISGGYQDVEIGANATRDYLSYSNAFVLTEAYDVTVKIELVAPLFSAEYYDLDGVFEITLIDSNGYSVAHDYETLGVTQTGGTVQSLYLHFDGYLHEGDFVGPFRIQYRFYMANASCHYDPNKVYDAVTFRITTDYAATLKKSRTGTKGVYIKLGGESSAWRENAYTPVKVVFGQDGHWPIVLIEVTNGSTTQRKLALATSQYIPFKRIGITIEPREQTSAKDIVVALVYGNPYQILPNWQKNVDYGDLSLADAYKLLCAPVCYKELGIIPQEPAEMVVYQEDMQGGTLVCVDDTITLDTTLSYGFTTYDDSDCESLRLKWDIRVENAPIATTAIAHLASTDSINAGDKTDALDEVSQAYSVPVGDSVIHVDLTVPLVNSYPSSTYVMMWIEINGIDYYIRFYPQSLNEYNPGWYRINGGYE